MQGSGAASQGILRPAAGPGLIMSLCARVPAASLQLAGNLIPRCSISSPSLPHCGQMTPEGRQAWPQHWVIWKVLVAKADGGSFSTKTPQ